VKIVFSEPFQKDYKKLPAGVQLLLDKALKFFIENPRHPSLQAKKIPGTSIWYARISRECRFTFNWKGDTAILRRIGTHSILNKERKSI